LPSEWGGGVPPEILSAPLKSVFHKGKDTAVPIPRYAGVELEFHDFKNPVSASDVIPLKEAVEKWGGDIIRDYANVEIRMAPAKREMFIQQVSEITNQLNKLSPVMGTPPNVTSGLHIHVRHLGHLMVVYSRLEPWILRTQPYSRFTSKYCRPLGPQLADRWDEALSPQAQSHLYEMKANEYVPGGYNNRYKAVNFAAWYKHRTIEVRCHEGTTDPSEIIAWASIWTTFVDTAASIKFKEAMKWPRTLSALRELVGEGGYPYLQERIEKYKAQWSAEKVESLMPRKPLCLHCKAPATEPYYEPRRCRRHW
jgi:hypothetical protein